MASAPNSPDGKNFWILLTAWGAILGGGIILMWESHLIPGLVLTIIGVIGLFSLRERPTDQDTTQRYTQALIVLVICTWATLIAMFSYEIYHRYVVTEATRVFTGWGGGVGTLCSATIDGSKLVDWKETDRVALICGVTDPTVDQMEDTRITITQPFTIQLQQMVMTASYSKEMADFLNGLLDQPRKTAPPPPGMETLIQWSSWYQLVLLPKEVDTSAIHSLSDVTRRAGKVIDSASITVQQKSKPFRTD